MGRVDGPVEAEGQTTVPDRRSPRRRSASPRGQPHSGRLPPNARPRDATAALEVYRLARRAVPLAPLTRSAFPAPCLARTGGIQTPLKSGLPLCSRGAGPAGVSGRVEAPEAGWALGPAGRNTGGQCERYRGGDCGTESGIHRMSPAFLAACFAGPRPVWRQTVRPQDTDSATEHSRHSRLGSAGWLTLSSGGKVTLPK